MSTSLVVNIINTITLDDNGSDPFLHHNKRSSLYYYAPVKFNRYCNSALKLNTDRQSLHDLLLSEMQKNSATLWKVQNLNFLFSFEKICMQFEMF